MNIRVINIRLIVDLELLSKQDSSTWNWSVTIWNG